VRIQKTHDALAKQLWRAARRWRLELRSGALHLAETSPQPALFVPHHHLASSKDSSNTNKQDANRRRHQSRKARRKLSARAPHVPLASHRPSHRQALAPLRVPTFWHYDVLRGLDYLRNAGIKPDSRVREAVEIVMARRHQNGAGRSTSSIPNIFH